MSFVYAIRSGRYVKIGVASDPEARMFSLQAGNPRPLVLEAAFHFGTRDRAMLVEAAIHQDLSSQRVFREWFRRSPKRPLFWLRTYYAEHQKLVAETERRRLENEADPVFKAFAAVVAQDRAVQVAQL